MSTHKRTIPVSVTRFLPGFAIATLLVLLQIGARALAFPGLESELLSIPLQLPSWVVDLDTTVWDLVHWASAVLLLLYAGVRIWRISTENHAARDEQTRKPKALLTSGSYACVRHPMYGMFMLNAVALLGSLGTVASVGFALLLVGFQSMNGIMEEKRELVPLFGTSYEAYRKAVPAKYFTPLQVNLLLVYGTLTVLDLIF